MKLIKIKKDYYLVDDSEIKYKDWYIDDANELRMCVVSNTDYWEQRKEYKKIISSTFRDAYGQIPTGLDLQEVKELIGEVDVRERVSSFFPSDCRNLTMYKFGLDMYNQALEDNKEKKYTEEDLRRVFQLGVQHGHGMGYKGLEHENIVIQSLQPKTEWEVEIVDGKLKLL